MNKFNHAFAMLTAAGGVVALAPSAQAVTLYGSFSNANTDYSETFQLQSDGGVADTSAGYTDFALTNDSLGNVLASVGDNTTGFKAISFDANVDSYFGTGPADSGPNGSQTFGSFKPAFYDSSQSPGVLQPGTYYGDTSPFNDVERSFGPAAPPPTFDGNVVVLSTSPAPEPEAWALLIAGAAMVGGARRAARKQILVPA